MTSGPDREDDRIRKPLDDPQGFILWMMSRRKRWESEEYGNIARLAWLGEHAPEMKVVAPGVLRLTESPQVESFCREMAERFKVMDKEDGFRLRCDHYRDDECGNP